MVQHGWEEGLWGKNKQEKECENELLATKEWL